MYPGSDPEHLLAEVLRRQEEVRAEARREAGVRRASRAFRGWSPRAFRLWRLHVMVWFEDAPRA
jgi:predicted secreted protein